MGTRVKPGSSEKRNFALSFDSDAFTSLYSIGEREWSRRFGRISVLLIDRLGSHEQGKET